jgi:uncharacterized protein YdhG (YjbR/CyaY superfamily)
LHRLILEAHPDAAVVLSYQMPTYKVGRHRLLLGVWRHGVSIYGWQEGRDAGFTARHPDLKTSKGTIRLRPEDAAAIPDDELRDLVWAALGSRARAAQQRYHLEAVEEELRAELQQRHGRSDRGRGGTRAGRPRPRLVEQGVEVSQI